MRKYSHIFQSVFRTRITVGLSNPLLRSSHLLPHLPAQKRIFKDGGFHWVQICSIAQCNSSWFHFSAS